MKKVKIVGTTYGYHNSNGRIEPKDEKSNPFMLDDAEAERLVSLGVAEIIEERVATPQIDEETEDAGENTPEDENRDEDAEDALEDTRPPAYTERPEYDGSTKATELREIGKNIGIVFPFGTTKEKMIEQLDAYFDDYFGETLDLDAEDPLA